MGDKRKTRDKTLGRKLSNVVNKGNRSIKFNGIRPFHLGKKGDNRIVKSRDVNHA